MRCARGLDRARDRAGFSLIELLGVVVVLGLIATIVTVNWEAMLPRTTLNSAVRALASTLQATRSDAIARNDEFRIQYDLDRQRYRVITPYRLGGGLAASEEERMALEWTALPDNVSFNRLTIDGVEHLQGLVHVRFDPLGAGSDHIVTLLQEPYMNYFTIEVQALTGLIAFHEGVFVREAPTEADFQ